MGIALTASGDIEGAEAAYEAGLVTTDLPEKCRTAGKARLNEALGDLRTIEADLHGLAEGLISRLEAALDPSE